MTDTHISPDAEDDTLIPCSCPCSCGNKIPRPSFDVFIPTARCGPCSSNEHRREYPIQSPFTRNGHDTVPKNITPIVPLTEQERQAARRARQEIDDELWANAWHTWQTMLPEKFKNATNNHPMVADKLSRLIQGTAPLETSGVLIRGIVGRGKTWLAIGYANDMIQAGVLHPSQVLFGTESELLASVANAPFAEVEKELKKLTSGRYRCIIVDDIGRGTWLRDDMRAKVFSFVFDKQWAHGNMVIATTNLSRENMTKYMGSAAMDRLLSMCGYSPDVLLEGLDKRKERTNARIREHRTNGKAAVETNRPAPPPKPASRPNRGEKPPASTGGEANPFD